MVTLAGTIKFGGMFNPSADGPVRHSFLWTMIPASALKRILARFGSTSRMAADKSQ